MSPAFCALPLRKTMETTVVHWGLYRDTGQGNGNYYSILECLCAFTLPAPLRSAVLPLPLFLLPIAPLCLFGPHSLTPALHPKTFHPHYSILRLCRDKEKDHGNYYSTLGIYRCNTIPFYPCTLSSSFLPVLRSHHATLLLLTPQGRTNSSVALFVAVLGLVRKARAWPV